MAPVGQRALAGLMQASGSLRLRCTQANYGRDTPVCIAAVKRVYAELELEAAFQQYEHESYVRLTQAIQKQKAVPPAVFKLFLDKIYKRTK